MFVRAVCLKMAAAVESVVGDEFGYNDYEIDEIS